MFRKVSALAALVVLGVSPMVFANQGDARTNVIRIQLGRGQNVTIPDQNSGRRLDAPYALTGSHETVIRYHVVIRLGMRGESTPVLIGDRE